MSGLCVQWRRDGATGDAAAFEQMLAVTGHRAVDGCDRWINDGGSVRIAHQHFWVTPEEVGECQPTAAGDVVVAFDGRVDNRAELAGSLDLPAATASLLSDAALVLRAYQRWGEHFVARLQGPFAIVVWDGRRQVLICARDRLGLRSLCYRVEPDLVLVASEAGSVLAWPGVDGALDEEYLAHLFALRQPPPGRTLFVGVQVVPPAHMLIVDADGMRLRRYWTLDVAPIRYASEAEYADQFRDILDRAVRRRLRAHGEAGVMMSGGMDSPSVAALAARQLSDGRPGARLQVFSYVFDQLEELDERPWMAPMVAQYNLDQIQVIGDEAWPLCDFDHWRWNPSGPDTGPFRPLNALLFAAASRAGVRVLLTGASSDGLFIGASSWLADLVVDRRYREAASELRKYVRRIGWRRVLRSDSVRRLAASLVGRHGRSVPPPEWLTARAAGLLRDPASLPSVRGTSRRPADLLAVLESVTEDDGAAGGYASEPLAVDVRDPYSDLELVEFTLALPAYLAYNYGSMKRLLRQAMQPLLPEIVLQRKHRSDLTPLYRRGMSDRAGLALHGVLDGSDAVWSQFVDRDWVAAHTMGASESGQGDFVIWQCVAFQWWLNQRESAASCGETGAPFRRPAVAPTAIVPQGAI